MSDRALVWIARAVALAGVGLAVAGVVIITTATGYDQPFWEDGVGMAVLLPVFFGVFVWLVIAQQPRNVVVWVMALCGFASSLYIGGVGLAATLVADPDLLIGDAYIPSLFSTGPALLVLAAISAVYLALFGWVTFGMLLFPDGKVRSPRWRWAGGLATTAMILLVAGSSWEYRPSNTQPSRDDALLITVGTLVAIVASVLCLVSLILRFRDSRGATRAQFKWVVWGGSILVPSFALAFVVGESSPVLILVHVAGALMLASYGIAVAKYRLYDIDLVISRTLVYGALAVFITGVYVAAVIGVGSLPGIDPESSPWLYIGATAVVAFGFEPLRARLQQLANQLVYGRRASPYEVLSDFSRNITADDQELLEQVARSLAEGTTAAGAAVWVGSDGTLRRAAVWPESEEPGVIVADADEIPGKDLMQPVLHDGEALGTLTLSAARGQSLRPDDERLLSQMASGMGLALRNLRLSEDLRYRVEELRRSRQRLVTVQDETRRHLERQLHDGAQQRLVALKVKLTLARRRAETSNADKVAELLENAATETGQAIDSLRDFARGIYPPLLEAEGLAAALASQVQKLPIQVTVHAPGVGRYDRSVEAAVYFSVLEALQNVVKHAQASSAHVALHEVDRHLFFEVSDDGRGFDPAADSSGSGLANLADRIDALDGTLEVISAPGEGTTLRGRIPSPRMEPAS